MGEFRSGNVVFGPCPTNTYLHVHSGKQQLFGGGQQILIWISFGWRRRVDGNGPPRMVHGKKIWKMKHVKGFSFSFFFFAAGIQYFIWTCQVHSCTPNGLRQTATYTNASKRGGGRGIPKFAPPHTTSLIDSESCFYCEGRGVRKYYPSPPRQNAHGLDRPMQAKGGLFKRYFDFSPGQKIEFGFETSPTTYPVPRSKLKIVLWLMCYGGIFRERK